MGKKYFLLAIFASFYTFGQVPNGYYSEATGTGFTLKTQLHKIIRAGHKDYGYNNLYDAYRTTDTDIFYEKDNSVLDMYSENPYAKDPYNYKHGSRRCGTYKDENNCYNREHIFPQGFFNKRAPMRSDAHHVVPSDGFVNNRRSNLPFGEVSSASWTSLNGSKVGTNTFKGYSGKVFEPIDEFKGDIARILLYFVTRYEDRITSFSIGKQNNPLSGSKDTGYKTWYINLLLKWHEQDPVSEREIYRNNKIYEYQGNRNPFIDHPEFVNKIWNPNKEVIKIGTPTNLEAYTNQNQVNITWNASASDAITYKLDFGNGQVYSTTNTSFNFSNLQEGSYTFSLYAEDNTGNKSTKISKTFTINKLGINDINLNYSHLKIYPNPSKNGTITIENLENSTVKSVQLYSILGSKIYNNNTISNLKKLKINNLTQGVYLLIIKNDFNSFSKKIVIE